MPEKITLDRTGLGEITREVYNKILAIDMDLLGVYQPSFTSLHAYKMASYIFATLKISSGEYAVDKQIMKRNIAIGFPEEYPHAKFDEEFEEAWSFIEKRLA